MGKVVIGLAAGIAAAAIGALIISAQRESAQSYIDPTNQALVMRGQGIYASHCASCHGANLEGEADWRQRLPNGRLPAPPHDVSGHTWHHPDAVLVDIVKHGLVPGKTAPDGYESNMPAYGNILTDDDIAATIAYIKSGWPTHALEAQKEVTLQQER